MLTAAFRAFSFRLTVVATFCMAASVAMAQIPNLGLPNQLRALQNQAGQLQQQNGSGLTPSIEIYQPVIPETRPVAPKSRLEDIYSTRAGRPLTQFGYDILGVPNAVSSAQVGAVQDDYILGQGDEIVVVLRGQEEETYRQRVNRDGQVILPRLNPIQASGRSLGNFRNDLEQQVGRTYISTNAFVSLGEVRQISVLVTGEVRAPGTRILNALATPLDALLISGGVAKTGSLRNVNLIRGTQVRSVDLYALLTQGNFGGGGSLQNGDRIYVPPLQNTVAVAGLVRRAGIYELRNNETALDAGALIGLAGGYEIAGTYRLSKMQLEQDGSIRLVSIPRTAAVANGEILFVDSSIDSALERVRLDGAVRLPGAFPRATATSVGGLIHGLEDITPEAYTPFAVVARRDPRLNTRTLIPFSLTRILAGTNDVPLQNDDVIYIFTRNEIRALSDAAATITAPTGPVPPNTVQAGFPIADASVSTDVEIGPDGALIASSSFPSAQTGNNAAGTGFGPAATFNPSPLLGNAISNAVANQGNAAGGANFTFGAGAQNASPGGAIGNQQTNGGQGVFQNNPPPNAAPAKENEPSDILVAYSVKPEYRVAIRDTAEALEVTPDVLIRLAGDHLVWVLDQVRDAGPYLAAGETTLDEMIQIAGGVLDRADLSFVEVTTTEVDALTGSSRTLRTGYKGAVEDFRRVSLRPSDVIRLRPIFTDRNQGQIRVTGEVRFPGSFDITRGERLSSVLERAGGLTDQAYAYGSVFLRRRAALAEREGNLRQARSLEAGIATLSVTGTDQAATANTPLLLSLAQQLRNNPALGRITITADPAVLRVRPELDVLLEPGDRLFIPKRPSTVTVSGEVLNTGSFQYETGLTLDDYIDRAGGTTEGSDKSRMFVVLPDGTARTAEEHWLTFSKPTLLPPGSTVVVPRDLRPFELSQFLRDAAQITSQIAITAASIAVLNR